MLVYINYTQHLADLVIYLQRRPQKKTYLLYNEIRKKYIQLYTLNPEYCSYIPLFIIYLIFVNFRC